MKRISWIILLLATLVGCSKNGSSSSIVFRKADISGASMLALASPGGETKAEGDYSTKSVLWKVAPDGSMVEVTYIIEVEGSNGEVAETIKREGQLDIEALIPIGNEWLLLVNARVVVPGYTRADLANMGIPVDAFDYLLRRSDGALFLWDDDSNMHFNTECQSLQVKDIDLIIGASGGEIYSLVGQVENHYFIRHSSSAFGMTEGIKPIRGTTVNGEYTEFSLVKIASKGQTLDIVSLLPSNVMAYCCLLTHSGQIASLACYTNSNSYAHILVNPSSRAVTLIQVPNTVDVLRETTLILLNGELYLYIQKEQHIEIREVAPDGSTDNVLVSVDDIFPETFPLYLIYSGQTASWISGGHMFAFNPQAKTYTCNELPAHYPQEERAYTNGVAYLVEETSALPRSFYKCDLAATTAEQRSITWSSEAQSYATQVIPGGNTYSYMAGSGTLIRSASLVDGRSITFYIDVQTNVGTCMISGSNVSGQVVTTLIRLN